MAPAKRVVAEQQEETWCCAFLWLGAACCAGIIVAGVLSLLLIRVGSDEPDDSLPLRLCNVRARRGVARPYPDESLQQDVSLVPGILYCRATHVPYLVASRLFGTAVRVVCAPRSAVDASNIRRVTEEDLVARPYIVASRAAVLTNVLEDRTQIVEKIDCANKVAGDMALAYGWSVPWNNTCGGTGGAYREYGLYCVSAS